MAGEAKETGNWVMTAARFVPLGGVEPEEAEEAEKEEEAEPADDSLDARLERAATEPDHEREEIFRYLKEFRRQKRRGQRLQRQEQAREDMRAEMDRVLREDQERRQTASGEAVAETPGFGIDYVEDKNGKLIKQRTSAKRKTPTARRTPAGVIHIHDEIYVQNEDGELVPYDGIRERYGN